MRSAHGLGCLGLVSLLLGSMAAPAPATERLQVAVSIVPQVWLLEAIGGEELEILVLVAPGESPHTYQPTDAQITRLMRSALYFRIGVPFENGPWLEAVRSVRGPEIVDLRQGIELREVESATVGLEDHARSGALHPSDSRDPHIWLSPRLLRVQARTVAEALARATPERRTIYSANLIRVDSDLAQLEVEIRDLLAPWRRRAFFIFHPAWGYFADDFGLRQVAIQVSGKEPSDFELTTLQRLARREGVGVVFVQPQIAGRSARAVAEAIGGRLAELDPLAEDLPENLRFASRMLAESFAKGPAE